MDLSDISRQLLAAILNVKYCCRQSRKIKVTGCGPYHLMWELLPSITICRIWQDTKALVPAWGYARMIVLKAISHVSSLVISYFQY